MKAQASRLRVLCVAASLTLAAQAVEAQFTEAPPPAAYALQDVTLVGADGVRHDGVTVVVRGGLIEAIGRGTPVPPDARVLAGDTLYVYPGLIDAHGNVAHELPRDSIDRRTVKAWAPTRAAQGFRPHRQIADYITARGSDGRALRRDGVVAVAVHPTDGLMPGQGALVLLRPDAASSAELLLDPSLGPVFTLRGRRGFYPSTVMGTFAFYRQTFLDAARHTRIAQAADRDARGIGLPSFDRDYAALQAVVGGATPVWFIANTSGEIRQALALSQELDFRPVIVGGKEAWKVADELKRREVPVLVSVDFTKPEQWKPESEDSASTEAGVVRERREIENEYRNPGRLAAAGVRFALASGGGEANLREGARTAIRYGLDEAAALRALTTTPAALLDAPALARVEAGMPANLVVADGPLFEEDARVRYTFVAGQLEEAGAGGSSGGGGSSGEAVSAAGTWSVDVESPQGTQSSTLTLTQDGSEVSGTMESELGSTPVTGTVEGNTLSFTMTLQFGGQSMRLDFSGTIEGDSASGTATTPMGDLNWTARRTAPGAEAAQ